MKAILDFWRGFKLLPSAWLLLVQLLILILSMINNHHMSYQGFIWSLGVLALLLIAKVIRQTPIYTALGLFFVVGAFVFSLMILLGNKSIPIQIIADIFQACAYFSAAYGLILYMFSDRYVTKDELFAAGSVFTLIVWAFAFLYNICQLIVPNSFQNANYAGQQSWLDLLFISFSLQSATGLSDLMPISPPARVLAMLQMFCGMMYLTLIVSRLVALNYIRYRPK
ncbi:ion channel [Acinetobacter gerneri]|uniref:Potassium channel domain-containing protein n=1 Tax=Acinetobacter gerneri DSM 14967 = CIP 107464 = MTCC 9824 TaxID=1120926 RepID=N8ZKN2_9GAMM|nr:ion channel [Acinetobacter gerneri]ENV32318.1 hypothetical protein F960_03712 [Acinetobacter gerneri DSM 14967 = CIP 107464 = MTCC 9824]EPR85113.1 Potassium channel protein [Acinetobacter gerneri DSM 14967 = CIP 107464 = MTCC 9824]